MQMQIQMKRMRGNKAATSVSLPSISSSLVFPASLHVGNSLERWYFNFFFSLVGQKFVLSCCLFKSISWAFRLIGDQVPSSEVQAYPSGFIVGTMWIWGFGESILWMAAPLCCSANWSLGHPRHSCGRGVRQGQWGPPFQPARCRACCPHTSPWVEAVALWVPLLKDEGQQLDDPDRRTWKPLDYLIICGKTWTLLPRLYVETRSGAWFSKSVKN